MTGHVMLSQQESQAQFCMPGNYQCVVTLHSEVCIFGKIEVVQGEILVCVCTLFAIITTSYRRDK